MGHFQNGVRFFSCLLMTVNLVAPPALAAGLEISKSSTVNPGTFDIQSEVWHATIAHMIAFQPKVVGFSRFAEAVGINRESAEGKKMMRLGVGTKDWPTITSDGATLVIGYGEPAKAQLRMRMVPGKAGEFQVNGAILKIDPATFTVDQFNSFLKKNPASASSESVKLIDLITPRAHADERGQVAVTGFLGSIAGVGATIGAGLAVAGAGALAVGGAVVAAGGATVGHFYCSLDSDNWSEYLNCMTAPLSTMGMNPRDNMFVRNLDCKKSGPEVDVASATGKLQTRQFQVIDGVLKGVFVTSYAGLRSESPGSQFNYNAKQKRFDSAEIDVRNPNGPGKYVRPRNNKDLDEAQALVRDFEYYKELCSDPERKAHVLRQIQAGNDKMKAYEGKSTKDLLKTSK